jgi:hypothetical protein
VGAEAFGSAPDRYVAEVLQKPTRARAEDTYQRAFLPRFIASCPRDAWKLCAEIEKHAPPIEIIRLFYYWLTARAEPILYRYVTEELFQVARAGTVAVRVDDLNFLPHRVLFAVDRSGTR